MSTFEYEPFVKTLSALLEETFESVQGYYLDEHTSLFETLADITAEEASIPVGGKCATLAAQVRHVAFYLDVIADSVRDPDFPDADWGEIWRTTGRVSAGEWQGIVEDLRSSYGRILRLAEGLSNGPGVDELEGTMAAIVHTAYHLGEIRQALCTLRP